jgi:TPP-dependent pyruvate/acetoin dehydrogenase alpha subunit
VTACFFGDGAVAEGEFHESLNLSALWRLPVLFICENNLYAMGTALGRHQSVTDLCVKPRAYGVPAEDVDGMDALAVEAAARHAVEEVRRTREPRFLECRTYRFRAHSMYDAELYRSKDEVARWSREHDPIENLRNWQRARGFFDAAADAALERRVADRVAEAVAEAEAGALEPIENLETDVYTPPEAP